MKRTVLKYTGSKTAAQLGSALVPESTIKVTRMVPTAYRKRSKNQRT